GGRCRSPGFSCLLAAATQREGKGQEGQPAACRDTGAGTIVEQCGSHSDASEAVQKTAGKVARLPHSGNARQWLVNGREVTVSGLTCISPLCPLYVRIRT